MKGVLQYDKVECDSLFGSGEIEQVVLFFPSVNLIKNYMSDNLGSRQTRKSKWHWGNNGNRQPETSHCTVQQPIRVIVSEFHGNQPITSFDSELHSNCWGNQPITSFISELYGNCRGNWPITSVVSELQWNCRGNWPITNWGSEFTARKW